ncbi:hypothetical protein GGS20DRAFT_555137 [Poronia punctata]|nr:hypothetical protein GGS20DRAFT_555137 [Poronia punctata]
MPYPMMAILGMCMVPHQSAPSILAGSRPEECELCAKNYGYRGNNGPPFLRNMQPNFRYKNQGLGIWLTWLMMGNQSTVSGGFCGVTPSRSGLTVLKSHKTA